MGSDVLANEPMRQRFEALFRSVDHYFQLNSLKTGVTETDIANFGENRPRQSLETNLRTHGFTELPRALRLEVNPTDEIKGAQRSDNVMRFQQRRSDGTVCTYNFFTDKGPEEVKANWSYADMQTGETVTGILTKSGIFMYEINTGGDIFYQQTQKAKNIR